MPGRILSVRVAAGARVAKGDVLVVLEAMKMEHAVRAPKDGVVTRVLVSEGQMVGLGDVLVEVA
jgi:biotin carboxyl carrier protein